MKERAQRQEPGGMRTAVAAGLLLAAILTGCVTETTGGIPGPAADDVRVRAQLDLARAYLENNDFDRARNPLNRALDIDPRSVEAHVLFAVLSEGEGETELAEAHYKLALKTQPEHSQTLNNYASFLYGEQRYEEAVAMLRKLVLDTDYHARGQAYENLGLAELKIGETERAKAAFLRSVRLNLVQPRSSLELADIAYADRDFTQASEYYDRFRTQAIQTPRSLCLGMKLAFAAGNVDQVASYGLALKNLFPDSAETRSCEVPR